MIFVTVGAQLPFDRLVHAVDAWALRTGRQDIFAQIGDSPAPPKHIRWVRKLEPIEYRNCFWEADAVVAHAGAGTIITAMEMNKPLLVMPRSAAYNETRTNHQFATARQFQQQSNLAVAGDERDLAQALNHVNALHPLARIGSYASFELLNAVRQFIAPDAVAQESAHDDEAQPAVLGRATDFATQAALRRKAA